jgi:anti-sigma regulatory factor (Ser/Thr protein kinase)
MPIAFRAVTRSGNRLRFGERVNDKALRDFVPCLYDAVNRGHEVMILDFSGSRTAYADAMLPIVCLLDHRRERGNVFSVVLPEFATLRNLFLNSNWAHLIDPAEPPIDLQHRLHLAASRYLDHRGQQGLVNAVLAVVLNNLDLQRDHITGLEWALNEITDNVLNHSRSTSGGLVQVNTFRDEHKVKFVVADAGRGIPAAMREAFPRIGDDAEAIAEAVKAGVTSVPDSGQGNGLAGTLRIATYGEGSFKISSGDAGLIVHRDERTSEYRTRKTRAPRGFKFPGTVVMFEISTNVDFAIEDALALGGVPSAPLTDVVDLQYSSGGMLRIRLSDEALGYGTRHAGVELRRKCLNLLNAEPTKRLVLDWSGVPLISSSFADEAVGKLFVELGPMVFAARVSNIGAESLVTSLLNRAVLQRVAQSVSADPNQV